MLARVPELRLYIYIYENSTLLPWCSYSLLITYARYCPRASYLLNGSRMDDPLEELDPNFPETGPLIKYVYNQDRTRPSSASTLPSPPPPPLFHLQPPPKLRAPAAAPGGGASRPACSLPPLAAWPGQLSVAPDDGLPRPARSAARETAAAPLALP